MVLVQISRHFIVNLAEEEFFLGVAGFSLKFGFPRENFVVPIVEGCLFMIFIVSTVFVALMSRFSVYNCLMISVA